MLPLFLVIILLFFAVIVIIVLKSGMANRRFSGSVKVQSKAKANTTIGIGLNIIIR